MNVTVEIDTSRLNLGLRLARQYSHSTLPELVNTAACVVAYFAKNETPYVTIQRIDEELGTIVTPVIGKRGKPLSQKNAENKIYSGGKTVTVNGREVPIAALIISASVVRPDIGATPSAKKYNQLTHFRWARASSPFKGVSRAAGAAAMKAAISRMIKRRHSSIKFLMSGWTPVVQALLPLSKTKFIRGSPPLNDKKNYYGAELGHATPATMGDVCVATIENLVGMEGPNAENYNAALMTHGMAALQSAVDREGNYEIEYACKKMEKELADFVNPIWR